MLRAKSQWFSRAFALEEEGRLPGGGARVAATLWPSWWSERATLRIEDGSSGGGAGGSSNVEYDLYREGWFGGAFLLEEQRSGGEPLPLARATKPSAWRNRFVLEVEGQRYEAERESVFRRAFAVRALPPGKEEGGEEHVVGRVAPQHAFTESSEIDLPGAWPLPMRAFTFWLALLTWRREAGAAGGAAGG